MAKYIINTDQFHIVLILLSCFIAYFFPFELFLLSYVILGALHYLTELTWLHEKKYFTSSSTFELIVIFSCAIVVTLLYVTSQIGIEHFFSSPKYGINLIFIAFLMAISAVTIPKKWAKFLFFVVGLFVIFLFQNHFYYLFLIGLLLPTLIHVFVFTGVFMLVGIKKKPTFWSKLCFAVFLLVGISFFIIPSFFPYSVSTLSKTNYLMSGFSNLNMILTSFFGEYIRYDSDLLFEAEVALQIQRFIAFAYTYHYLNWFSKVHIIAWHKVNKLWLSLSILLWLIALGIYFYDFKTGLLTLYFLSILHVLMEFPLNIQSISILIKK
ncbi:hypothetical protein ACE193_06785 [Bernardetia sp. OM2101]|uniref:hypothetical protein n=1 Tax=Bernardetia sp. OM2101 TaxID=3344876 RepID=UPI0035CF6C7A